MTNMNVPRPFKSETQRYAAYGALFGLTFPIVGTLMEALVEGLPLTLSSFIMVQQARPVLWIVDTAPIVLGLFAALAGHRQNVLMQLNERLNARERELQHTQINLESRVQERTRELKQASDQAEARASRLQAIAEISQSIALTQNPQELFPRITRAISERLGFYHTGIYLLDSMREYALLQAANSEGGQRMLAHGHRVRAGEPGIVSFVTQTGRPRIALDSGSDVMFMSHPDLPRTRSELALPLNAGGELIGVLDVQSEQPNAFNDEDVSTLNTLASQVAIVIQNARLFDESRRALENFVQGSRRGWLQHVEEGIPGYSYLPDGTLTAPPSQKQELLQGLIASNQTVVVDATSGATTALLAIPVKLRDQVIGVIHIEAHDANRKWSENEIALVQSISERTALALENARLFEETSRRAERERLVSQVTSRISESNNFEHILHTTIQELGRTLGATRTFIQLASPGSRVDDADTSQADLGQRQS
ncbi:MAG: GAF domain-containing protein [Chloroflexota bacterium]